MPIEAKERQFHGNQPGQELEARDFVYDEEKIWRRVGRNPDSIRRAIGRNELIRIGEYRFSTEVSIFSEPLEVSWEEVSARQLLILACTQAGMDELIIWANRGKDLGESGRVELEDLIAAIALEEAEIDWADEDRELVAA